MIFKRLYVIFIALAVVFATAFAQNRELKQNANSQVDTSITVPPDFDNTLDYMLNSWAMQHAKKSNCESSTDFGIVSDSIYKLRLSRMPCLMEMPYNTSVRAFIDLYTIKKRTQMEFMLGMSKYYFPMFEQVLSANNLPLELRYLSIIESALNPTILSPMGAAGLWQLMIGTARMYGLEVNSLVDERMSPMKATNAAAHFLKDLYSIYGDWNLVIASYNCGPGNVNKAIRRAGGKRDFWAIYPYLPRETRSYVPIFIAANYAMTYAAQHNLCPAIVNMPALTDTIMVHQRIHLEQVADVLNMPIEEVRLLNPQYRKDIVPGDIKPYALCLPINYTSNFIEKYNQIVAYKADSLIYNRRSEIEVPQVAAFSYGGSGNVIYHKVRRGETLGQIAARNGVSLTKLKKWNHIRHNLIKPGQRLKIIR